MTLDAEPECRARPRAARPEDVLAAVPLIVSSGPVAIVTVQGRNAFTGPSGRVADTWRMAMPV